MFYIIGAVLIIVSLLVGIGFTLRADKQCGDE